MGQPRVKKCMHRILGLCIILLSLYTQVYASNRYNQGEKKVTIVVQNVSRKEIMRNLEKQTGMAFFYRDAQLHPDEKISMSLVKRTLDEAVKKLLEGTGLIFEYNEYVINIKPASGSAGEAIPGDSSITNMTLKGKITDAEGKPIPGAGVMIKGSNDGTTADSEGYFSLNVKGNDVIVVRALGYQQRETTIKGKSIHILLNIDIQKLNTYNAISSGYQRVPRERATGSFAFVNNELFNKRVGADVLSRLEGNVPGLIFNKNTINSETGGIDINIQGHSTLFSNDQPLVVVDNFAYDGDIKNINPNDVESITILRDAAAASIWGVRSGNGVIVITTKKGRQGQKLTAELNTNLTISEKPNLFYNPNFLNSSDYISIEQQLFDKGYYDDYQWDFTKNLSPAVQIMVDAKTGKISQQDAAVALNNLGKQDIRNDLKRYLYQTSIAQQYALSIRGGGANTDYTLSLGYDRARQSIVGNKDQRITLNSIYNFYPTTKLRFTVGVNIVQLNNTLNGNAGSTVPSISYLRLKDSNGKDIPISTDYSIRYKDSITNMGFLNWQYYPLQEIANADNKYRSTDNRVNLAASYNILNGLSAELSYQYQQANNEAKNYYSEATYYARNLINLYTSISPDGSLIHPIPVGGILITNNTSLASHQARAQLNYNKSFSGIHSITSIAGVEIRSYIAESSSNSAYGYDKKTRNSNPFIDYTNSYPTQPFGSARIPNNLSFGKGTNNYLSYYGNISYQLKNTYDISLSGRIDHSNIFGVRTNQKAVPLYSAGLGYTISNADFYHISWMQYARLRATFGYNGNVNNSATAVTTTRQQNQSPIFGQTYAIVQNPGNTQLRWEKIQKINFGYEFIILNSRISGTIDYYLKKGIDLFGYSQLAPSTGQSAYFGNNANTRGHGFDIVLNTKNIQSRNFLWSNTLIVSHAIDKVTKYSIRPDNAITFLASGAGNAGQIIPIEGAPVFGIYSFKSAGLSHETGDPQGYVNGKESTDYAQILTNTNVDSLQYIGPSRPTFFGSLRNSFTFKGMTLSFNTTFKFNYYFRKISMSNATQFNADYTNRWQKPGDEMTTYVPFVQFAPINNDRSTFYTYSSPLVEKADHIRIQDISLSYDIRREHLGRLPFAHLQFYGYVNNIGIIWRANNRKIDPDVYGGGLQIPTPRSYALGLKAAF